MASCASISPRSEPAATDAGATLASSGAPAGVILFVRHNLAVALHDPTIAVAASFFWGREASLADLFRAVLAQQARAATRLQRLRY